eukprot:g58572.t1
MESNIFQKSYQQVLTVLSSASPSVEFEAASSSPSTTSTYTYTSTSTSATSSSSFASSSCSSPFSSSSSSSSSPPPSPPPSSSSSSSSSPPIQISGSLITSISLPPPSRKQDKRIKNAINESRKKDLKKSHKAVARATATTTLAVPSGSAPAPSSTKNIPIQFYSNDNLPELPLPPSSHGKREFPFGSHELALLEDFINHFWEQNKTCKKKNKVGKSYEVL